MLAHVLPTWLWRIAHWPVDTGANGGYGFWSGIGSGSPIFVVLVGWLHHRNCVERGCWRIGHPDPSHGHPVCRRHSRHFRA